MISKQTLIPWASRYRTPAQEIWFETRANDSSCPTVKRVSATDSGLLVVSQPIIK